MANQHESENQNTAKKQPSDAPKPAAPHRASSSDGAFNGALYWCLIVFLFGSGLWPIALFLLISGLGSSSKKQSRGSTARAAANADAARKTSRARTAKTPKKGAGSVRYLTILGAIIALIGALEFGEQLPWIMDSLYDFWSCIVPLGWTCGGLAMIWGAQNIKRQRSRYTRYMAVIGDRRAVEVSELEGVMQLERKRVLRDLERMLSENYLGESAYVDVGRGVLFLDADAAAAYTAAREERTAPQAENEAEPSTYDATLRAIRTANDRIADPVVSEKLDRLETLAGRILKEVDRHPQKEGQARRFLNYYLPTTRKLLESYAEFDAAGIDGENLTQAKLRIEQMLDALVDGFAHQLDALYTNEARDIDSELRVMETMLASDTASAARDFGIDTAAAQEET